MPISQMGSTEASKAGTGPGPEPEALGCSCCISSASPLTFVLSLSLFLLCPRLGPMPVLRSPVSIPSSVRPTSRTLSGCLTSPSLFPVSTRTPHGSTTSVRACPLSPTGSCPHSHLSCPPPGPALLSSVSHPPLSPSLYPYSLCPLVHTPGACPNGRVCALFMPTMSSPPTPPAPSRHPSPSHPRPVPS